MDVLCPERIPGTEAKAVDLLTLRTPCGCSRTCCRTSQSRRLPMGGGGVAGEGEQGKCACIVMSILKLYGWVSRSSFRVVIRCLEVTHA